MKKADIYTLAILLIFASVFVGLIYSEQIGRWIDSTILYETQSQRRQILEVG